MRYPFEEVKKELDLIPIVPHISLACQQYSDECEEVINEHMECFFFLKKKTYFIDFIFTCL